MNVIVSIKRLKDCLKINFTNSNEIYIVPIRSDGGISSYTYNANTNKTNNFKMASIKVLSVYNDHKLESDSIMIYDTVNGSIKIQ